MSTFEIATAVRRGRLVSADSQLQRWKKLSSLW
jgi:hypothetical protein